MAPQYHSLYKIIVFLPEEAFNMLKSTYSIGIRSILLSGNEEKQLHVLYPYFHQLPPNRSPLVPRYHSRNREDSHARKVS